ERSRQEIATLLDASKRIRSSLDLQTTLNSILDTVVSMLRCDVAGLALLDDNNGHVLRYAAARGPRADLLQDIHIGLGSGLLGAAARTGETVIARCLQEDARWIAPQREGAA